MWLDFYMFLTLASGIALAVLGWQLCSIHIPHREDTHRLRTARAILAASYFILAIPAFCELFNGFSTIQQFAKSRQSTNEIRCG